MLSLLKRKTDAAAADRLPAWHPNFRNYEQLPDTKVVRTSFFLNGGAVFAALALLVYVGINELQLNSVNTQVKTWEEYIARDKPASDVAITQFRQFQAEEAKLNEVSAFLAVRPVVSDLVLRIAQTLPEHIALDVFELREATLRLRATVRGTPDTASGFASHFVDQLKMDEQLAPLVTDVVLANVIRVPTTGMLSIEVVLQLKAVEKAAPARR